ncbi:MAG: molybdopterin-binding protein [Lachnospiraceae bacterium]|jgi:hypothetical protein|nr:molybdopterin-binding protein [Lachnospiraceae bacterium]
MKEIKTTEAIGQVLCHDMTQIIPGKYKGARFRKGHIVTPDDIPVLLSMGKETIFVWENDENMLHENDAAEILYDICAKEQIGFIKSEIIQGKIEILAESDGFFEIDTEKLKAINALGEIMIAARHTNSPVKKGDKLAGMRVIPLVILKEKMALAKAMAGEAPLIKLTPYKKLKYAIVTIGNEVFAGRIKDSFTPVVREKLSKFEAEEIGHVILADDPQKVTAAILDFIGKGAQLVLCTGGMSVDPDDRTPLAIKNTGADIVSYGSPVLPGAMLLVAYYGNNQIPIVGLPGCVMYSKRTVFDILLPRIIAGKMVSKEELSALGNGGMCLDCPVCIFPNCAFGAGI